MGLLINIDNGGTLTDVYATNGEFARSTKTLTTPFDLSKCFFDGLSKVSKEMYGAPDLARLLTEADHIRYSSTQGTNSLVERKGPRLGLLVTGALPPEAVRDADSDGDLYRALVGDRHHELDLGLDEAEFETAAIRGVNNLVSAGANRIVVAHGGADSAEQEKRIKRILLRRFPQHLLGAVPILYSHELAPDSHDVRRTWTALFNAFLHSSMERFLYTAEHKLRANNTRNPLLIFRNDGDSARVAKTTAIKTHSSGPRGGLEGARVLAEHYGFEHLLTVDVGGTTTDIGEVRDGLVRSHRRGRIEKIDVSLPLCDLTSVGLGGSSIIRAEGGDIKVGPDSVGSTPGPACFGLGGTEATITDAFRFTGLLDPASYLGGELELDIDRARRAIDQHVAEPLGMTTIQAAIAMEEAWIAKIGEALSTFGAIGKDTTLMAFGGAGPIAVSRVADAIGIRRVLIPGLAAVFSAFGLSFSDVSHEYHAQLVSSNDEGAEAALASLMEQAKRGMAGEGFAFEDCETTTTLEITTGDEESAVPFTGSLPSDLHPTAALALSLTVRKPIQHPRLADGGSAKLSTANPSGTRQVELGDGAVALPLYQVEEMRSGAMGTGPAVLEQQFFTCHVTAGWEFLLTDNGDLLLTRT